MIRPWWDPEPDVDEAELLEESARRFADVHAPEPGETPARDPGAYGSLRCPACGRLRLTYAGEVRGPCGHEARS